MKSSPIAFMSYSHADNQNDNDYLRKLCEHLSNEICVQTGEKFIIFFDRKDLTWGQNWAQRIEESIDATTFFIPIITPNFFKSEFCRSELERFLQRQEKLKRKDLVLPIFYIEYPLLNDEDLKNKDELAFAITTHQWVDWQKFRFSNIRSQTVRRAIAGLARQICDSLERTKQVNLGRDKDDDFYTPRKMDSGDEQNPLPIFLQMKQKEPRKLLEEALWNKQSGDYGAAKESLLKLIQRGIDWSKYIDLYVDLLYFSVSTYDKLEEWKEIDYLEKYYFIPTTERIKEVITADAYRTIQMGYQSQMALVMLRQTRLEDALKRITDALEKCEGTIEKDSIQILCANALTTRALIQHAMWAYRNSPVSLLTNISNDLGKAENLYRKYAKMGQPDELHHLGRYYGIQTFLQIALSQSGLQAIQIDELLFNAKRTHSGNNRTAYGIIAGQYCDAFCHYQVSNLSTNSDKKVEHLMISYALLREARNNALEHLGGSASLTHMKILGLLLEITKELDNLNKPVDPADYVESFNKAKESLLNRGYSFLEKISFTSWLSTPLN
jgi:hypothetical protein